MSRIFAMLRKGQRRGNVSLGYLNWTNKARNSRNEPGLV
jgi:hypothetical protein